MSWKRNRGVEDCFGVGSFTFKKREKLATREESWQLERKRKKAWMWFWLWKREGREVFREKKLRSLRGFGREGLRVRVSVQPVSFFEECVVLTFLFYFVFFWFPFGLSRWYCQDIIMLTILIIERSFARWCLWCLHIWKCFFSLGMWFQCYLTLALIYVWVFQPFHVEMFRFISMS